MAKEYQDPADSPLPSVEYEMAYTYPPPPEDELFVPMPGMDQAAFDEPMEESPAAAPARARGRGRGRGRGRDQARGRARGGRARARGRGGRRGVPTVEQPSAPVASRGRPRGRGRGRMSLREILITTGNNPLPRPPHTPPQRPVTPERRREPAREFLVSAGPSATPDIPRPPPRRYGTDSGFQPNRTVATEDTPVHQLYYPLSLSLALKKDEHIWNDKQGNRSENTVFVLIHQVDDDNEEVFVYLSPTEANVHALELMVKKHPTAFALPRIEEAEVKKEEYERASSVARKIGLRTAVQSQQIIRVSDAESGNASQHVVEEHVWIKSEDPEDQFRARAPDVRPDTNNRGEILLGMGPEIKYIYWGDWKIVSHGLKMEARQLDETRTKITVSLKNLRKPRK